MYIPLCFRNTNPQTSFITGDEVVHLDWEKNLGNTDRLIRFLLALLLLALVFTKTITGWWAALAFLFSLIQFVEAAFAY